jgi:gliding motility-associated-like protein
LGASLSTQVVVLTPTPLDLGPDSAFCDGAEAYLQLPAGFFEPLWSTGSTADAITITAPGSYSVAATDAQGCIVQDLIVLDAVGCPVFVPNVFSPNGDGVNDVLDLPFGPYISTSMSIFDRWGSLVWEGDPARTGFRGVHHLSNEPLSEGVYYYILRLQRTAGRESEQSGYVHLLR